MKCFCILQNSYFWGRLHMTNFFKSLLPVLFLTLPIKTLNCEQHSVNHVLIWTPANNGKDSSIAIHILRLLNWCMIPSISLQYFYWLKFCYLFKTPKNFQKTEWAHVMLLSNRRCCLSIWLLCVAFPHGNISHNSYTFNILSARQSSGAANSCEAWLVSNINILSWSSTLPSNIKYNLSAKLCWYSSSNTWIPFLVVVLPTASGVP